MKDLRVGLYGLNANDLEQADFMGLSAWEYSERYKDNGPLKPLTDVEKREAWKRLFLEQIHEHEKDLKLWLDGDSHLLLGWFRKDGLGQTWIIIRALIHTNSQTIVAIPLRREETTVAWFRPWMGQQVWQKLKDYRLIVPPGVF